MTFNVGDKLRASALNQGTAIAVTGGVGFTSPFLDFGGAQAILKYRLMPDGTVWLTGDIKSSASVTSGAAIFTLPVGFRPATNLSFPGSGVTTGGALVTCTLNIATTGAVSYSNTSAAAQLALLPMSHIRFPTN